MFYKAICGDYVAHIIRVQAVCSEPKPIIISYKFRPRPPHYHWDRETQEQQIEHLETLFINRTLKAIPTLPKTISIATAQQEYAQYAVWKLDKELAEWRKKVTKQWKVWLPDGTTAILNENPLQENI